MGNVRSSYSSRRENDEKDYEQRCLSFLSFSYFSSYKQFYFAIHPVARGIDTFNTASSKIEASRNCISC